MATGRPGLLAVARDTGPPLVDTVRPSSFRSRSGMSFATRAIAPSCWAGAAARAGPLTSGRTASGRGPAPSARAARVAERSLTRSLRSREADVARSKGLAGPRPAPGAIVANDDAYTRNSAPPAACAPEGPIQAMTGTDDERIIRPSRAASSPKP